MTDRREIGRKGNAAARAADPEHQSKAGRAAIRSVADKYANGDIGHWMAHLRSLQSTYQLEQAANERNARTLANGLEVACEELPICTWPEDDPTFWMETVSRQGRGRGRAG